MLEVRGSDSRGCGRGRVEGPGSDDRDDEDGRQASKCLSLVLVWLLSDASEAARSAIRISSRYVRVDLFGGFDRASVIA